MGDFFSGLTLGDQIELGTATLGSGIDPETWNAMMRQELDERALAVQVQKHGPGHGRDARTMVRARSLYASDVLVLANKLLPVCVSLFNLTSHIVAPAHPTRRRLRTHWFASTAQEYTPTIVHM